MIDDEIPLLSYMNDHEHQAHFYGEPFLDDRVIWYFDGVFVYVTGYDIDLAPVDRTRLLRILAKAETRFEFDHVFFESPSSISIKRAYPALSREITSWPSDCDGEIFVTPESYRFTRSRAEIVRRAHRAGLECAVAENGTSLTLNQWALVVQHLDQGELTPYYKTEYLTAMVCLFGHRDSVRFEIRLQGKLVGFALVKARHPYAVFQLLYIEPHIKDVSDLTYFTILEHFLGLGYRRISLGVGANSGIKSYKQKWTTTPITAGLYDLYWVRDGVSEVDDDLWFSRILARLH